MDSSTTFIHDHALLPNSESPNLCLTQPTPEECTQIWEKTASSWKDALTVPLYLAESQYLTTIPLAKDGGMTTWILVDRNQPPDKRKILCSCETYRKQCLTSDKWGNVEEGIIHAVASVFCPSEIRGRAYGTRHMKELAKVLDGWQSEYRKSVASVLYSDIGKRFYTRSGWLPNPSNGHFVFPPVEMEKKSASVHLVTEPELEELCRRDEALVYKAMTTPSMTRKRVVILPNLEHMLWHIRKEDFVTNHIFGKNPQAKGAIAGSPGKQVWAIWVHRYYGHPDQADENCRNVLSILRLVVEGDNTANKLPHEGQSLSLSPTDAYGNQSPPPTDAYVEQAAALHSVLRTAQAEAAEWRLDQVDLWDPSPLVKSLIGQGGIDTTWVERENESIASALWFKDDMDEVPVWVNNEYYAWC